MTREEAIETIRRCCPKVGDSQCDFESAMRELIPELRKSEDERIRKNILALVKKHAVNHERCQMEDYLENLKDASKAIEAVDRIDKYIDEHLANAHDMKVSYQDKKYYRGWDDALGKMSGILQDVYSGEKQKERPKEELVYRLNGLMQDYIKEGKDEEEREHRLKCYQLFWNALEDAEFFQQKEQKPVNDKAFEEWIDGWYNEHHRDGYITMDEREFKNFCRGIRNMYQQKPTESSDEELQRHQDELHNFKVFAVKQAKEHHISFVYDFEWNNFCAELLSYFNEKQKPVEWDEEDEKMLTEIINSVNGFDAFTGITLQNSEQHERKINWLKSLRPQPKIEWSEKDEKMRKDTLRSLECYQKMFTSKRVIEDINDEIFWLKSLILNFKKKNEDVAKLCSNEWSDEDEKILDELLDHCNTVNATWYNFLKSLRPSWKPSEE